MSGEMAGGGDPYLPHDPPIHGQDPDHTLGGQPISVNTLGGTVNIWELLH